MSAHQALEKLLLSLFSADELRRFLRYLPDGDSITGALPGASAAPVTLAHEAVKVLERDGLLVGPELWDRMITERPRRQSEIDQVRAQFKVTPQVTQQVNPQPTQQANPAAKITVLMVSANPEIGKRLRVDHEFRDIVARVRGSRHRDRFDFVQLQAASFADLTTALMEHEPHVLHISSHGSQDGSLVFETSAGVATVVGKQNLLTLLDALKDRLRLVLLNACFSHSIASEIPPTIDLAIGMNDAVVDQAAIDFGVTFYEALGFGKPVETAFKVALAKLLAIDGAIPRLYPPADADPHGKRKLKLLDS